MKIVLKKEDQKFLNRILIVSALIIAFASIEALFYAKDINNFKAYEDLLTNFTYNDYLNLVLFNLFLTVINPIILSLYTFFTIARTGINDIYKMFFGFSTVISLAHVIFQFNLRSIFYYIVIILNVILFVLIVTKERT